MALFKAAISLSKADWPADAQSPRRSVPFAAMAAGMALVGVLAVPSWTMVNKRPELKPDAPGRLSAA
jgi:hypothetical protein